MSSVGEKLAYAGGALALLLTALMSAFSPRALPFALWALAPYAALWYASRRFASRETALLGAGMAAIVGELAVRAMVLRSSSSTASIAFVFSPLYLLLIIMPAGAGLGHVLGGVWRSGGKALRGVALGVAALALVFEFLAIAAPDKLPMNVARSKAALARIGEPRVVLPGALESVVVSTAPAWYQPVERDGRPGDELAQVDGRGAGFLDVETFAPKGFEAFIGDPGRLWGWMSQLVPVEGGLAVAQTGGGFSETRLQRLDGSVLWAYQPDENLKPSAMIPADLEGDRVWEFYAASRGGLARLDLAGKRVWSAPAVSPEFLGALARQGAAAGWVAGLEYGRRAFAVDERGAPLGGYAVNSRDQPFCVADTPWGRAFLHGGKGRPVRGVALDGRELFALPLGDFTVVQAVGFEPASGPALALLGASTDNVGRFRLLVVGKGGEPLYDEILPSLPWLRVARRPDGRSALLIIKDGLRLLR